jgi:arginine decarboxylase
MTGSSSKDSERSISRLYNASQLRVDTWTKLKYAAESLARLGDDREERQRLRREVEEALDLLDPMESYFAFPGTTSFRSIRKLFDSGEYAILRRLVTRVVSALIGNTYRRHAVPLDSLEEGPHERQEGEGRKEQGEEETSRAAAPYFEVLVVDDGSEGEEERLRDGLRDMRRSEDRFVYDLVVVPSMEDALIAVLFNPTIQTCVIHHGFRRKSGQKLGMLDRYLQRIEALGIDAEQYDDPGLRLAWLIGQLRPELDCFLVTDLSVEAVAGRTPDNVRRVFYSREDFLELHLNVLRGVNERYKTPFFNALKEYSIQPTGVFHAMPISRGKSVTKSHWIQDMAKFYGVNIFLAETSATSGGLDSLLDPQGPIKRAQERAARAFGAQRTYFVTNGTSTANKIVLQGLIQPDDVVLVDRSCHKSHHYGFVLAGARACYLDAYPLHDFSMYGAVSLKTLKETLLAYKAAGKLEQVKMILLTNSTFDGIVYNVERVMEQCLAIKPDLIFLWDEAWFAYACCAPMYRQRSAMAIAARLRRRYAGAAYRRKYQEWKAGFGEPDPDSGREAWMAAPLMPDPEKVRIRVYSTQSTHKTLTSLRQGSMIHVYDQDFASRSKGAFQEAFMTHTSTSPNYQIIASLDLGRRQVQLEGFELVQKQTEMAMTLRQRVMSHPLLSKYFRFLTVADMIPDEFRESGLESYFDESDGWAPMMEAWAQDEFVLDPCRLTLYVGGTGVDGDTFKTQYLMRKHGIQVNKTSRNTVLFMTHIGTTRSSVAYLIEVLVEIAQELEEAAENAHPAERRLQAQKVQALTKDLPPLPDFSRFHALFLQDGDQTRDLGDGDLRRAYFMANQEENCEYMGLNSPELEAAMSAGRELVSSKFIIPYPPGFPLLVPGQILTRGILEFMRKLDVKEIHGYQPELGLRLFKEEVLDEPRPPRAATSA